MKFYFHILAIRKPSKPLFSHFEKKITNEFANFGHQKNANHVTLERDHTFGPLTT
jgi:hypothetical protein